MRRSDPTGLRHETWTSVGTHRVHAWEWAPPDARPGSPLVALAPGLGLPSYAEPTMAALAGRGLRCVLLDLPGFGTSGGRRTWAAEPTIEDVGRRLAGWVRLQDKGCRIVIVGHSTAAQAALIAALDVQDERPDTALVMAGPTFQPAHRGPWGLARVTPFAYRADSLRELCVLPDIARGRFGVLRVLRSGLRDAPDERIAQLRLPVTFTAGRLDAYAPESWLRTLQAQAVRSPATRIRLTGGSHNHLFTHPDEVADAIAWTPSS